MRLSGYRLPLPRLSATSLSTFLSCPEQFRQKYLLKVEETMSGERFMGAVTHEALDRLFNTGPGLTPDEAAEVAVSEAWEHVIEHDGQPEWYDLDATEQYRRARQMVKAYWPIASEKEIVASEERFEEEIAGVPVIGYIDRTLSDRILEVKTASQKVSKPKPRWSLQGRLYSLVSDLPIEWNVVTRQVTPKVYTAEECEGLYVDSFKKDTTVLIVKHAVERMNDLYGRYGKDNPWPMDGLQGDWSCDYCSFKNRGCPAWI